MTRQQLKGLGLANLRQLARRVGLAGAGLLSRDALLTGLSTYYARSVPRPEEGDVGDIDEEGGDCRGSRMPPSFATSTMARLLESQGKSARAREVRARLRSPAGAPASDSCEVAARALGATEVAISFRLRDASVRAARKLAGGAKSKSALIVRLFVESPPDPPTVIDLALETNDSPCQATVPHGSRAVTPAIGVLGERFAAVARGPRVALPR